MNDPNVVVIGSGPNGLAAAAHLARQAASVLPRNAKDELECGARTADLTLPGFANDARRGALQRSGIREQRACSP